MVEFTEIFIPLLDEEMQLWRLAMAQRNNDGTFLILEQEIPDDEIWKFLPGDLVIVEKEERFGQGYWTAIELADQKNQTLHD